MTDRVFIDTNILIYSLDPTRPDRRATAAGLIAGLRRAGRMVTSPQTLNECYRVLTDRRQLMARLDAQMFVGALIPTCTAPSDRSVTLRAWEILDETGFAWWDCLMMASALFAGCRTFVTEDAQSGRIVGGMTLVDPFRDSTAHLLGRN